MIWEAPDLCSATGDPPPKGGSKPESGPEGSEATASRGRVLIVEDDYFVALTSEAALVDSGFDVLGIVASGEEAIERVSKHRPDLVVMDIRLAGSMNGIETARELRLRGIDSLFASAHADQQTRQRAAEAKPVGWLTKPYSDGELIAAVQVALERQRKSNPH